MQKKKNISAFLRNTYAMLEREDLSSIVAWGEGGNGFVIKNLERFSSEILPQYFKHQKYTSFVRQLNMYGFHKQRYHEYGHESTYQYFAHDHFRKGDSESEEQGARRLLAAIRRKPEKKKKAMALTQQSADNQPPPIEPEMESLSSSHEVSVVVEGRNERKSSIEGGRQEWSIEESSNSQPVDQTTERVMQQNEMLRNLHTIIREEVLQAKKRSIERLTSSDLRNINNEEIASIGRLASLLLEGAGSAQRAADEGDKWA